MTTDFAGRCVLVTGAAGGVGRAFLRAFAETGATLVLANIGAEGMARGGGAGAGQRLHRL